VGAPDSEAVRRRIALLREHRWSSYRAYIGLAAKPVWLECEGHIEIGRWQSRGATSQLSALCGSSGARRAGAKPLGAPPEQVVLGGLEFLKRMRETKGPTREAKAVERMAGKRPDLPRDRLRGEG